MDALVILLFLLGLAIAALFDYRKRTIPDVINGGLWLLAASSFGSVPVYGVFISLSFGGLILLNEVCRCCLIKRPLFGWGDILFMPPFFSLVKFLFGEIGLLFSCGVICVGMAKSGMRKEGERGEPLAVWMLACALLLTLAELIHL